MKRYNDKKIFIWKTFYSHLYQIYFSLKLKAKEILEIGNQYRFVSSILCQFSNLTTLDFNDKFNPDILMDITNLKQLDTLKDEKYDLILLCEVLEHIPYEEIEGILQILRKKTKKYIVISAPNVSGYFSITLFRHELGNSGFKIIKYLVDLLSIQIGNIITRLDYKLRKKYKKYMFKEKSGHHWELGIDKYDINSFRKLLEKYFIIILEERVREHPFHHFFVLKKRCYS